MFQKLIAMIRQVIDKMLSKTTIREAIDTNIEISDEMSDAIDLWHKMYLDKAPWVAGSNGKVKSLNLPSAIASELARLATIEMASEITKATENTSEGESEGAEGYEDINEFYQDQVIDRLKVPVTYAAAMGGMIFKPYILDGEIVVDYIQATNFIPVSFSNNGEITSCIFPEKRTIGDDVYTKLEHHTISGKKYTITNTLYVAKKDSGSLGKQVDLDVIEEWANLASEATFTFTDKARPLFAYFKMPLANTIDTESHLGVSVYADAADLIEQADKQYSRTLWEYEAGEMAIEAGIDMFKSDMTLPENNERLYRKYDTDIQEGRPFYEVFNPDLRDESLWSGLDKILRRVEFSCGLAYGTLSDTQVVSKTAEEIKASKQRSYSTVADIQKNLESALEQLVWAMLAWRVLQDAIDGSTRNEQGNIVSSLAEIQVPDDYEISFEWDDSLIVDSKTEQGIMMSEVAASIISPEYYLKKRYGATEEQIKEMMGVIEPDDPPDDKLE